jgi:hypothetical protein
MIHRQPNHGFTIATTFDITVPAGGWVVPAAGAVATDFTVAAGYVGVENGLQLTDVLSVGMPSGASPTLAVGFVFDGAHVETAATAAAQGTLTLRFHHLGAGATIPAATVFPCAAIRHTD